MLQHFGGVLEALVFEQPVHQLLARIFFGRDLVQLRIFGQQHARLDVDQRRGHVDELGAQLDVQFHGALHVFQILLRDGGNGDVVDVDLLFANQVEQQVERTIVLLQVEIKRRGHCLIEYQSTPSRSWFS